MNTKKAVFVTVAMTVMMVTIMICLILLKLYVAFGIIAAVFFTIGVFKTAAALLGWLCDKPEETLEPVFCGAADDDPDDDVPPVVTATVEEIMREVNG